MTRTLGDGNLTPRKPGTDRRPQAGEARSSTGKPAPGGAGRLPGTAGVPRKVSRARGRRDLPRQRGGEPWSSPQDRACGKGGRPPNAASPPSLFLMGFYVATVLSSSTPGNRGVGGCWSRSSPQSRAQGHLPSTASACQPTPRPRSLDVACVAWR